MLWIPVVCAAVPAAVFTVCESKACKGNTVSPPDILLILGCRVRGNEAEETLMMRIERAAEYLRENKTTIAVACGGIVHKDQFRSEAEVIKEELVRRGIESDRIILEDKSKTTAQNFINAEGLVDTKGRSVAFLSSEFHLMRASMIAKRCNFNCTTIAAPSPKKLLLKNYVREFFALPLIGRDTRGVKKK